ncbi:hypothetical protein Y1Q_0014819 [Alligator mississippiensis]|uniref:Uncharacterized protein n=1 Tax=Alligator mississippiensis TaxID=8496 RepID=A0A151M248_ALLMI|nr:hypothetical protein Y1Q_0014819 [Alligator mississippiensis]
MSCVRTTGRTRYWFPQKSLVAVSGFRHRIRRICNPGRITNQNSKRKEHDTTELTLPWIWRDVFLLAYLQSTYSPDDPALSPDMPVLTAW